MELTVLFGLLFGRKIIETATKKRSRSEICSQIFTANHAAKTRCKSLVARWRSTFTTRFAGLRNRVAAQRQHQGICWYMVRNMLWTCYWLIQWSWILNFPVVNDQVISWFNAHVAETSHDSWRSPHHWGCEKSPDESFGIEKSQRSWKCPLDMEPKKPDVYSSKIRG